MKRGNAGNRNSGWKRCKYWKPILHSSKNPETPRNFFLEFIRIIERKKHLRGPTPWPRGWGARPPVLGAPLSPGPPGGPPVSIFCYMKSFILEKIRSKLLGRNTAAMRRNQSRAPAKLFCQELPSLRGKSKPSSSPTILSS